MRVCVGCGNFLHRPQIVAKLIMKAKELPPVELLREWFIYDPLTGDIYWKNGRGNNRRHNKAGYTTPRGRRIISLLVDNKPRNIQASRLAYALYHGVDPLDLEVDHIDRDPTNNRIDNLRLATRMQNNQNRSLESVKKAIKIRYPDGRGEIVVDSIRTAARLLNRSTHGIAYTLKHSGKIYWGWGGARQDSGIRIENCAT